MTMNGGRRLRWRLLALVAALFVVLFVPVERYRPSCGGMWDPIYFEGSMRDEYVGMLTEALAEEGFFHIRIGNEVFVKLVYPLGFYESQLSARSQWRISPIGRFETLHEFLINNEWRIAHAISDGYGPGGRRITPPQPLVDALAEYRRLRGDRYTATAWQSGMHFGGNCQLLRAAAIRIEDVKPEQLQRFVPHPPHRSQCHHPSEWYWDLDCGYITHGAGG